MESIVTEGNTPGDLHALCLPATLCIAEVADWRQHFSAALASGLPLALDAAAVERVDGAALQLLLAFHLSVVRQSGRAFIWRNPSPALCDAAALLGMSDVLGLPPLSPLSMQSQKEPDHGNHPCS